MKTYTFKVVVEPDERGYHAYCPALRHHGAVTQGATPEEALKNINEVVQMIVDELVQDHVPLPTGSGDDVEVFDGTRVAVTVQPGMAIDYSKLRSLTAREMMRALLADGFALKAQRGSHKRYQHADGRRVTLPYHSAGATFVPKTLRSMIEEQARWTEEDLQRLGLAG